MNSDLYSGYNSHADRPLSFLPALFSFPLLVLMAYVWPTPTTFARQKAHAHWSVIIILLSLLATLTGIFSYAWGRLLSLNQGIQALSLNHLSPHSLTLRFALILAMLAPLLLLTFAAVLHMAARSQQGKGTYRAQLYSVVIIETPLVLLLSIGAILLFIAPSMGTITRIPFAVAALLLVLYSLLLLVPSLMGIQHLSGKQAALCLVSLLIVTLIVVIFFEISDGNQTSTANGSGKSTFRWKKGQGRFCPYCGFSLAVYDKLHDTVTQSCPKCGKALM